CIFVDHGLLRLNEREQVERTFRAHVGIDLRVVHAEARFLEVLAGIEDPEEKRRRIGHTFIDVFEAAAGDVPGDVGFLVQGTLYPDVIESASPFGGPSVTIKTHHNVAGLYDQIWQAFAVLLPIKSVGVMGDFRTYDHVVALRAVTSRDGMTADWYPFPTEVLGKMSSRIINEVRGVNRVVYDVSSKPPATIEWE